MPTPQNVQTWPNSIIPYVIDHPEYREEILSGMKTWEQSTPVRFVPRTTETAYVRFTPGTGHGSNASHVGYKPNAVLEINLAQDFLATHELGHALGLIHEQQRSDRDAYVEILWANVRGGLGNQNFVMDPTSNNQDLAYDPESVMQYGKGWQSANDQDTERWIGDPSQGIHKDNGWSKLTANDQHAVNRLYLPSFPGSEDLLMYRGSTGYLNTNFTTADRGIPETWAAHWSKDYTLMATYQQGGKPHVVVYRASSGYINTNVINDDGSITELWNTHWSKDYTLMATYQQGGKPHLVIYRASSGYINTNVINDDGSITELWNTHWSKDYTLMETYQQGGKPQLVIYRASSGYINTNAINDDGSITERWNTHWSKDYTLMTTYQLGGRPQLVIYRASSGYINTNAINDDGSITELWNTHWSKDYSLMASYQSQGSPYLAIYRDSSGYINTNAIRDNGSIDETWNTHWSEAYTLMATVPR